MTGYTLSRGGTRNETLDELVGIVNIRRMCCSLEEQQSEKSTEKTQQQQEERKYKAT